MTISSARRLRGLCLLAAALCLASAHAGAQEDSGALGEPLRLAPLDIPAAPIDDNDGAGEGGGAADSAAGGGEAGTGTVPPPADAGTQGGAIEVDPLDELAPDAIGVLDPGRGGFPADMWAGTARHVVAALLPRIPGDLRSPVLRQMARRLLLSSAAPPPRRRASADTGASLLKLRARRLAALGETGGLLELLRVVPQRLRDGELASLRVEALFLSHRREAACGEVRGNLSRRNAAFWTKALAVCQLAAGERDQANLTLSLLREQGHAGDTPFFALFDAAEQGPASTLPAEPVEPLHFALTFAGGLDIPIEVLDGMRPAGLLAVAGHDAAGPLLRARAAEEAAARGALPAEALRAFYSRFSFDQARLADARTPNGAGDTGDIGPVRARALKYQAARGEAGAAARAELVRDVLAEADPGLYLALAELYAPIVAGIEARPELAWFAQTAGRALYAAGRDEAAANWLTLARQESIINPAAAAAVTALWPYARLSGAAEVPLNGGLAAWRSTRDGDGEARGMRESLLRAAFQALGASEPRGWVDIAADGAGGSREAPPAALLYALETAGEGGRLGETVLLALIAAGQTGLERCHPLVLGLTMNALAKVGLEAEARRLAIEAAVANGI